MTTEEKATAFDLLAEAMTNRFASGKWGWWCPCPGGGDADKATREDALKDLVAWAGRAVANARKKKPRTFGRYPLQVIQ